MKNPAHIRTFRRQVIALAAVACAIPSAHAQFNKTAAGTYDYLDTANWTGGTINNAFSSNPAGNQTITFGSNHTLSSGLTINNTGLFNHTFTGASANRTLTLGGNISLGGSTTNANTVTFGSLTDGQKLNIDVGGATRTITVSTNRTMDVLNEITGTGGIIKNGTGTLRLSDNNSYTGATQLGSTGNQGVLEVTKLANGGENSSIGKSSNAATGIVFGGQTTATLRYIGSGDSTDRRFSAGGVGAIFDASGGGALKWTNTNSVTWSGTSNAVRALTFAGTSTHDNTMAAAIGNNGTGATSITKKDAGRWILSGNNTYTGTTTIEAGTLELGSSTGGGNSSNLILNGGTFATGGFDETFGTLTLNGNATIDFGASNTSDLIFSASDGVSWGTSVGLSIINFNEGFDTIRFGTNQNGLSISQLGKITINGFAAAIDEQGFLSISAVPEPSAFAALAGLSILGFAATRRRR